MKVFDETAALVEDLDLASLLISEAERHQVDDHGPQARC